MIKDEYLKAIEKAGFKEIKVLDEKSFSLDCVLSDPDLKNIKENEKKELEKIILSIKISAFKK